MIISEQKPFDSIIDIIQKGSVFIIGCSECAALCHVGGEPEVLEMEKKLIESNINVTGWIVLDPACHLLNNKRLFKSVNKEIDDADHLLVLSCGNGVQVIEQLYPDKHIISGTNTLFVGAEINRGIFERECNLCGSCIVDDFEGLCPISHCPKQLMNGPCGGSMDGKCEINRDFNCIWDEIINKKNKLKKTDSLMNLFPPKDWTSYKKYQWRDHHKL